MWIVMAVLSALFAGLTSILAKCGIRHTDSDLATAIRTIVVLIFAWIMVFVVDSFDTITNITTHSMIFLVLSGLATGASWICYFKALSLGDVNKVVPIDKSSTVLTVLLAIVLFGETNHPRMAAVRDRFGRFCRFDGHSRESRYYGRRVESRHGDPYVCRARYGLGNRVHERETVANSSS